MARGDDGTARPDISIVVTVHGRAASLPEFFARSSAVVERQGWRAEWVFVNDASPDDAERALASLMLQDSRVRVVGHVRNLGQHRAIHSGIVAARGRRVAVMDGDLEDPPEELPPLVAVVDGGTDIAIATYSTRHHARWRHLGSQLYSWLLRGRRGARQRLSTFSVLSDAARSAFLSAPHAGRAYLIPLLGIRLPTVYVASHKERRRVGSSAYAPWRLAIMALRNVLLFRPDRLLVLLTALVTAVLGIAAVIAEQSWSLLGIWAGACLLLCCALMLIREVLFRSTPPGDASVAHEVSVRQEDQQLPAPTGDHRTAPRRTLVDPISS